MKPLVAINNWLLGVAGAPAVYLPQVSGLTEHAVTCDRRPGASAIVDTWLRDPSRFRPAYITIDVLNAQGTRVTRFQFNCPQITRVVSSVDGSIQTLTVTFDRLIIC